jgi:hypothetical protein
MGRKLGIGLAAFACAAAVACSSDDDGGGGSGGSGGSAGSSGSGGSSGSSGSGGAGGSGGSGATGGSSGSAGAGGAGGGAGSAGSAGSSGAAGSAGAAGAGGAAGAAGAAGAGGAAGSGGDKSCTKLNEDYVKAVTAAKKCVYGTSPNPCSVKVKGDLECQCPTFVNPANAAAMAELTAIEAAWTAKGCVSTPTCLCADPLAGACYAGPGGPSDGSCHDG